MAIACFQVIFLISDAHIGVSANSQHGLRRTNGDKRRAVEMLMRDSEWVQWSDRQVAKICCVGHSLVADVRKDIYPNRTDTKRTVSRNGKTYTVNTSKIGKREPSPETKSTVDDLLNTTYQNTSNRLATALENAEDY